MRVLALVLALSIVYVAGSHAQSPDPWPATGGSTAITTPLPTPVPTPPPDYIAEIRANFTPENRAYSSSRSALGFVDPFYALIVALILLFSGLSARMRDIAYDLSQERYPRMLIYFTLYSAVVFVLGMPLAWAGDFALEHRYGLSSQPLVGWLGDQGKALLLQIVYLGVLPVLALAYHRMEVSPRRWWLWFSVLSFPLLVATVLIDPLVIEPMFNKFTPLQDTHLRDRILALAARAEIPAGRVDQVNKSVQTNKYNAYVSGFGASQHIVLWDTTLRGMKEDEILFVTGHEIGHYKLNHIWKGIAASSLANVALFLLIWLIAPPLVRRFGARWGFTEVHDPASLPLLAALMSLILFVSAPAYNAFTRGIEHEADVFALEITHDNDAGARSFIQLGSQNRSNPEPSAFVEWVQYTHPPLIERVRFAMSYHPWEEGRPNQFFHEMPRAGADTGAAQPPTRMTVRQEEPVSEAASRGAATTEAKRGATSPGSRRHAAMPSLSNSAVVLPARTVARRPAT